MVKFNNKTSILISIFIFLLSLSIYFRTTLLN
nr:MAG TPA: hypothetical protein [Caudoviricetes sp.]